MKLRMGNHHNSYMQNSYQKHGSSVFTYEILELTTSDKDSLETAEQFWLDNAKFIGLNLYNVRGQASSNPSRSPSLEVREIIRLKATGRKHSEATKAKLREIKLGNKLSEEHKEKIRVGGFGRKHSEETKLKMSKSGKGRVCSDETKEKIRRVKKELYTEDYRIGLKGRVFSEETRAKMSVAQKLRFERAKNV